MSALNLDSNVTIKCIDKYGKVTRTSCIHNKATYFMVEGLLRFLKGDFNLNNGVSDTLKDEEMKSYQPTQIRVGNVGVKIRNERLSAIDSTEFKIPTFDDYKLQQDIHNLGFDKIIEVSHAEVTSYDDPNNSLGLLVRVFLPAKYLIGTSDSYYKVNSSGGVIQNWIYYNEETKEYETLITELGLCSDNYLLARVLFDGNTIVENGNFYYENPNDPNNPIVQTETSSLVIEWRIGLVSLGQNDIVTTHMDSFDENLTKEGVPYTINSDKTIVTKKSTVTEKVDDELVTRTITDYYYVRLKIVNGKPKMESEWFYGEYDNGEEVTISPKDR